MLNEAVRIATGTTRRYRWSGGRVHRDLNDEREALMVKLAKALKDEAEQAEASASAEARGPRPQPQRKHVGRGFSLSGST